MCLSVGRVDCSIGVFLFRFGRGAVERRVSWTKLLLQQAGEWATELSAVGATECQTQHES